MEKRQGREFLSRSIPFFRGRESRGRKGRQRYYKMCKKKKSLKRKRKASTTCVTTFPVKTNP